MSQQKISKNDIVSIKIVGGAAHNDEFAAHNLLFGDKQDSLGMNRKKSPLKDDLSET
jgi:hypothetical protein|tara:strand:+ start:100 stop:270 length:171 start_codon:yes stop_codon:yes gene_type:complete